MSRAKRVVLFGAIIVVAAVVAMPFLRKNAPVTDSEVVSSDSTKPELSVNASVLKPAANPGVVPTDSPATIDPPDSTASFTGQLGAAGAISDPSRLMVDEAPTAPRGFQQNAGDLPDPPADVLFQGEELPPRDQMRKHVIRDGDSLPGLAARMLGSADRASEIFQANRDVLSHPDLLPIGETLVIPPK